MQNHNNKKLNKVAQPRKTKVGDNIKIKQHENGVVHYKKYTANGVCHREDGPAYTEYDENGNLFCEKYFANGLRDRKNKPACIKYHVNGVVAREEYYTNGILHRKHGPAIIEYDEQGCVVCEIYYLNGKNHRGNGPAYIGYYANGNLHYEYYCKNDILKRENGPIYTAYTIDGEVMETSDKLNDISINIDNELAKILRMKQRYLSRVKSAEIWEYRAICINLLAIKLPIELRQALYTKLMEHQKAT